MKWNKEAISKELIKIKDKDGQVNCGHIHKNYTPLRGAVYRYFESFDYEFQFSFPYFCVDFYLPKHKCVLWCDGDYWHANPDIYKTLTARQQTQRRLDKSQESYLNNRNIRFLRLWGSDIKNNDCENEILNLIKEKI